RNAHVSSVLQSCSFHFFRRLSDPKWRCHTGRSHRTRRSGTSRRRGCRFGEPTSRPSRHRARRCSLACDLLHHPALTADRSEVFFEHHQRALVFPAVAATAGLNPNILPAPPSAYFGLFLESDDVCPDVCSPTASVVATLVRSPLPNMGVSPPSANFTLSLDFSTLSAEAMTNCLLAQG